MLDFVRHSKQSIPRQRTLRHWPPKRLLSTVLDLLGHHCTWRAKTSSCLQSRQERGFARHASNVRKDTLSKPTGDSVYRAEMRYSKSQRSSIAQRKDHKNLTRLKVLKSFGSLWKLRSQLLKLSAASLRSRNMFSLRPEQRAELL